MKCLIKEEKKERMHLIFVCCWITVLQQLPFFSINFHLLKNKDKLIPQHWICQIADVFSFNFILLCEKRSGHFSFNRFGHHNFPFIAVLSYIRTIILFVENKSKCYIFQKHKKSQRTGIPVSQAIDKVTIVSCVLRTRC